MTPHSHPVLSLSTQYGREDQRQLATFPHENLHWWVIRDEVDLDGATAESGELFPDAPGREGGGARDVDSTYLHLVVCDLEYRAISILLGEARAREVIEMWTHYPWVYERVLNDPRVHDVNARDGLVPPSQRAFAETVLASAAMSDPEQIERLATLARLELSPEERDALGKQIDRILGYVAQLERVSVDGVPPTSHAGESLDVRRPDEPRPSLPHDEALAAAPEALDGHFAVPHVLPGND